ncbi:hypothetical protein [Bradyrhizobium ottawaense]|uniref:hypothetical protein n=1 Tax=Bradyrhizobium ottawaense TaxID=931866 RepID=UPI000400302A|nr:hypothetical protein [Bradyrhizobium ottawaense]
MVRLLTIFALFAASSASAEDATNITLRLTPAEVIALQRSLDRQPISQTPPPGFWSLQVKLSQAVEGNPEAKRAVEAATK